MQLPLAYRPNEEDDWGFIRDATGALTAVTREHNRLTSAQLATQRSFGIDPAEETGRAIVRAVNSHDELVAALKAAYCHLAQPYAGTPDAREMVRKAIAKAEQST